MTGSIDRFQYKDSRRAAELAQLLEMGVSLSDATGGRIYQSDLTYLRYIQQRRVERAAMDSSSGLGGKWERVG